MTVALALAACGAAPPRPPPAPFTFSGEALEVPVGGKMVDDRSTTVRVDETTRKTRTEVVHAELVYLGFLENDPSAPNTIRARYQEHRIVEGVEKPVADFRAEVRLDLSLGKILEIHGWRVGVVEATPSAIKFVAVKGPP